MHNVEHKRLNGYYVCCKDFDSVWLGHQEIQNAYLLGYKSTLDTGIG